MGNRIIIANWKMQLTLDKSVQLATDLVERVSSIKVADDLDIILCPSYDALAPVQSIISGTRFGLGAQDVFWQERGAYTGEISASMLRSVNCSHVIVGHSERRRYLGETDEMVNHKITTALSAGLVPILCVGETYDERRDNRTEVVLMQQVIEGLKGILLTPQARVVIAYEPVWVIGSGQAIDPQQAAQAAEVIHQALIDLYAPEVVQQQIMTIYGGSVDASNAKEFVNTGKLNGALVGTASLLSDTFIQLLSHS